MKQSNFVSREWLKSHLEDPQVVIVDCRFELGKPEAGRHQYEKDHIPGAVYMDLEEDLSGPKGTHGGRHPLPDLNEFVEKIGKKGIDETVTVIAYDDGGEMAARFWWMLRFLGHSNVKVLDGGYQNWVKNGLPVTDEISERAPRKFVPNIQSHMLVDMEYVKKRDPKSVLIDARAGERFRGDVEPIDPVAGHIPGAVNYFWKEGLRPDGTWKTKKEQQERFRDVAAADELIVYCGSGVTACANVLALEEAGLENIKLYLGSWSDWCSYSDNPVAKGEK
ncbi:thiosulfate sulfurtransferase [Collibacillus ludicampi]|uniref:Thiosulfate sulfurtransferase n=1 Tax=Collibacillus ludicampi TaxID=2771369 RepID=A0AAV4LFT2_9BACL|nr:sulfurtransferase [Collibacillus ludicampi]GIM46690.1 thiosulfate sulfurtransferase [Collibacillus ludicampi]